MTDLCMIVIIWAIVEERYGCSCDEGNCKELEDA